MLHLLGIGMALGGLGLTAYSLLLLARAEYLSWRKRIDKAHYDMLVQRFYLFLGTGVALGAITLLIPPGG